VRPSLIDDDDDNDNANDQRAKREESESESRRTCSVEQWVCAAQTCVALGKARQTNDRVHLVPKTVFQLKNAKNARTKKTKKKKKKKTESLAAERNDVVDDNGVGGGEQAAVHGDSRLDTNEIRSI
jgi:hypothetical protein